MLILNLLGAVIVDCKLEIRQVHKAATKDVKYDPEEKI
jgi:hypothetical protein